MSKLPFTNEELSLEKYLKLSGLTLKIRTDNLQDEAKSLLKQDKQKFRANLLLSLNQLLADNQLDMYFLDTNNLSCKETVMQANDNKEVLETEALAAFFKKYKAAYMPLKKPSSKPLFEFTNKCAEELGEVCEAASAVKGKKSKIKKLADDGKTPKEALAEEIMDVMINLLNLSYAAKLEPETLFKSGIKKLDEKVNEKLLKAKTKNEPL